MKDNNDKIHTHTYYPINSGTYDDRDHFGNITPYAFTVYKCNKCNHQTVERELAKYTNAPKDHKKISAKQFRTILRGVTR